MKLPNAENATVAPPKITRYLLDPTSERGQDKARFFSAFGFTIETWQVMEEALKQHALTHPVASVRETEHGSNYSIEGELITPDGRNPAIRTIWIIRSDTEIPSFVTAYPL